MRIRILGSGWYGCSIGLALHRVGHDVVVHEIADRIFSGASGGIPARLHAGFHYPRSRMTRAACQEHYEAFMAEYAFLTRGVPINLYAIARDHSLVDFDQYVRTLRGEVDFIPVHDPGEFGLFNVEGAVLTGERHIVTRLARDYFEQHLAGLVQFGMPPGVPDDSAFDFTVDCTFCANSSAGVDRFEPCLVLLLRGPTDKAVTVMDGPYGSIYPWDEDNGLCSLSSAKHSPFSKECRDYQSARAILDGLSTADVERQGEAMIAAMAKFYPAVRDFEVADYLLSIRAMPLSGADSRLVDVARAGERTLRVRAGKIDAVIAAEKLVKEMICSA
jgi:hypothetical protein